jgi:hypothetical protein
MKNVHLITKEQEGADVLHQYLYITSEEDIGDGDWYYLPRTKSVHKCIEEPTELNLERRLGVAKIILTDNPDLIADGVQAIDNEFLEWFVKNPSCEWVEVIYDKDAFPYGVETAKGYGWYKIIIPQEEPKQIKCYCGHTITCDCEPLQEEPNKTHYLDELPNMDKKVLAKMWESAMPKLEPKQETLEEVAEKYSKEKFFSDQETQIKIGKEGFIAGAKWQAERMYSELEVFINELKDKIDSFEYSVNQQSYILEYVDEWFEQLKKK